MADDSRKSSITNSGNNLTSEELAGLIVDALLDANVVDEQHLALAVKIVTEEIDARKYLGDY